MTTVSLRDHAKIEEIAFTDHKNNSVDIYTDISVSITSGEEVPIKSKKRKSYCVESVYYYEYNMDRDSLGDSLENVKEECLNMKESSLNALSKSDLLDIMHTNQYLNAIQLDRDFCPTSNTTLVKELSNRNPVRTIVEMTSAITLNESGIKKEENEVVKLKELVNILFEEACRDGGNHELIRKIEDVLNRHSDNY